MVKDSANSSITKLMSSMNHPPATGYCHGLAGCNISGLQGNMLQSSSKVSAQLLSALPGDTFFSDGMRTVLLPPPQGSEQEDLARPTSSRGVSSEPAWSLLEPVPNDSSEALTSSAASSSSSLAASVVLTEATVSLATSLLASSVAPVEAAASLLATLTSLLASSVVLTEATASLLAALTSCSVVLTEAVVSLVEAATFRSASPAPFAEALVPLASWATFSPPDAVLLLLVCVTLLELLEFSSSAASSSSFSTHSSVGLASAAARYLSASGDSEQLGSHGNSLHGTVRTRTPSVCHGGQILPLPFGPITTYRRCTLVPFPQVLEQAPAGQGVHSLS
mmetsp:Transcript_61620/g.144458  ORF Transcript_61620/g.144458 Transcript_61620/m.144458 type:complete len:336 (-) Transcript_61620:1007-2014(-)